MSSSVNKLGIALVAWVVVCACSSQQTAAPCTRTAKGFECTSDAECCTGYCLLQDNASYCQDKPANPPACVAPQGFCTQDRNCCAGLCQANVCFGNIPPNGCLQIGSACTDGTACCSANCQPGSLGASVCVSPVRPADAGTCKPGGAPCGSGVECCAGVCNATTKTCGGSNPPPNNCGQAGAQCRYGSDCCSMQCTQLSSTTVCK